MDFRWSNRFYSWLNFFPAMLPNRKWGHILATVSFILTPNQIIRLYQKKKSNLTTGRCYNKQKHVCSFSPQSHAFNMTRLSCHGDWALLNHLDPSLVHAAMLHLRIFRTGSVTSVATDEIKMPVSFEYFVVSLLPDHVDEQTCCFITPPRVFYPYFLLVFWNCSFEAVTDCCWKLGVFVI